MKTRKLLIASLLVMTLIIGACVPVTVETQTVSTQTTDDSSEPLPTDPYPIDDDTQPTETETPETPLPTAEVPTQTSSGDIVGGVAYNPNPAVEFEDIEDHVEDMNEFAMDLYERLAAEDGNLMFSPYGIYQALLMVYAGADAETRFQIARALELDDDYMDDHFDDDCYNDDFDDDYDDDFDDDDNDDMFDDDDDCEYNDKYDDDDFDDSFDDSRKSIHSVMNALNILLTTPAANLEPDAQPLEITIANALWLQDNFSVKQDFLDTLSANYNAGLKLVDFSDSEAARQAINLWVAAQTNDRIRDLIPEGVLDELTRLVITNAVYFKGAWQDQFDPANTSRQPFFLLDGTQKEVDMMHHSFTGAALVFDSYQAVKLPYDGGNFAMAAIMPTRDFKSFEMEFDDDDDIEEILKGFQGLFGQVTLAMPKFQTESSFDLSVKLRDLGMVRAFEPQSAQFTRITDETDLYITDVLHKAFIDVNEQGTEAAAATAVVVGTTSMPADAWEITLDRPFIYVIYETTTNAILFMGRVVNP